MENIKKFENFENDSKQLNLLNFEDAFVLFVKGSKIIGEVNYPPFGDHNKPVEFRFYGEGVLLENGYKLISYGGGASGEDYNEKFIIDSDDNLVAKESF